MTYELKLSSYLKLFRCYLYLWQTILEGGLFYFLSLIPLFIHLFSVLGNDYLNCRERYYVSLVSDLPNITKVSLKIYVLRHFSLFLNLHTSFMLNTIKAAENTLVLLSLCLQLFVFFFHRQMIVWYLQMALCSTSYGYYSN